MCKTKNLMKTHIKNKEVLYFVNHVAEELKRFNGKLKLKSSPFSISKKMDGEFSECEMSISCYYDPSSYYWVGVLAHEYGHFLQCKNEEKIWADFQENIFELGDLEEVFTNKKNLKKAPQKRIRRKILKYIIALELDADKRAIKLINKFKLPVNKKKYVSYANLILYKYLYWSEKGYWPDFIDNNTLKRLDPIDFKISKFKNIDFYLDINKMPRKIFYSFEKNRENFLN